MRGVFFCRIVDADQREATGVTSGVIRLNSSEKLAVLLPASEVYTELLRNEERLM